LCADLSAEQVLWQAGAPQPTCQQAGVKARKRSFLAYG